MASVAIRLGTSGKAQVRADLDEIAASGDAAAKRHARAWLNAANDVESAIQRQSRAADKIAMLIPQSAIQSRIADANGTGFGQFEGSARESAAAFRELLAAQDALDAKARALIATLEPAATAQATYNARVAEAKALLDSGRLSLDQYALAERRAAEALNVVVTAEARAHDARQAKAAALLNDRAGVRTDVGRSAEESAAVFSSAYVQMEARAEALLRAVDPVRDAQARFNTTIGEARGLVSAGVMSLDDYVTVLRTEQATLDGVARAHGRVTGSSNALRQATAGASYQVQDFVTQISMGANPVQAFIIQGGQLAGQFMHVEGRAGAVARMMMGPWGLAFQVGLMVLAPFVAKLWEESEADKKAREAKEEHRKAVLALADAQEKAITTAERKQALDVAGIKLELDATVATRMRTQAELEKAQATLRAELARQQQMTRETGEGSSAAAAGAAALAAGAQAKVDQLTAALKTNAEEIARLQKGFDLGFSRMVDQRVTARSTQEGRIRADYDRKRADAMQELSGEANAFRLASRLRELNAERDRELKKVEQSTKVLRDRDTLTSSQVSKMLREELPGVHVTSTTGGRHVKNSYHYRNQAVDFVPAGGMSSMTKADVRRIFESRGIEIVELLGPGDKGHSNHFHVAWTKGKLALDEFTDAAKRARAERKVFDDGMRDTSDTLERMIGGMAGPELDTSSFADIINRIEVAQAEKLRVGDYAAGIAVDQRERLTMAERELELVGANDNVRARELEKLRLILDLRRAGVVAGSDEERAILANADALDAVYGKLRRQEATWDEIRSTGDQVIDRLFDPNSAETWGERVKGVLGDIRSELLKLALINPLKNWLYGDDNPTLGGVLGKLFGVAKSVAPTGGGGVTHSKAIPNAVGTEYFSGGAALVGEFGPEIVSMPRGSRVTTAGETRRMFAANDRGGDSFHFDLRGAVMTEDLLAQMNAIGSGAAVRGAAGGAQLARSQSMRAARRRLPGQ